MSLAEQQIIQLQFIHRYILCIYSINSTIHATIYSIILTKKRKIKLNQFAPFSKKVSKQMEMYAIFDDTKFQYFVCTCSL